MSLSNILTKTTAADVHSFGIGVMDPGNRTIGLRSRCLLCNMPNIEHADWDHHRRVGGSCEKPIAREMKSISAEIAPIPVMKKNKASRPMKQGMEQKREKWIKTMEVMANALGCNLSDRKKEQTNEKEENNDGISVLLSELMTDYLWLLDKASYAWIKACLNHQPTKEAQWIFDSLVSYDSKLNEVKTHHDSTIRIQDCHVPETRACLVMVQQKHKPRYEVYQLVYTLLHKHRHWELILQNSMEYLKLHFPKEFPIDFDLLASTTYTDPNSIVYCIKRQITVNKKKEIITIDTYETKEKASQVLDRLSLGGDTTFFIEDEQHQMDSKRNISAHQQPTLVCVNLRDQTNDVCLDPDCPSYHAIDPQDAHDFKQFPQQSCAIARQRCTKTASCNCDTCVEK